MAARFGVAVLLSSGSVMDGCQITQAEYPTRRGFRNSRVRAPLTSSASVEEGVMDKQSVRQQLIQALAIVARLVGHKHADNPATDP